jgi:plastocyanin
MKLLALGLLLLAAAPASAATRTVRVEDFAFKGSPTRISPGDSVRWRFLDANAAHNVASRGTPRFKSSPSQRSGSYTVRFAKAGTYRYVCTIHPGMTGRVVVTAAR